MAAVVILSEAVPGYINTKLKTTSFFPVVDDKDFRVCLFFKCSI